MKKWLLALTYVLAFSLSAFADTEKPINENQLPVAVKQFLKKYFNGKKIAMAKLETDFFSKEYDVILTNGDKLEFYGDGNWKKVSCKKSGSAVPMSILPSQIVKYLKEKFPGRIITHIERKGGDIKVKLSDKWKIKFNSKCQVIDINN